MPKFLALKDTALPPGVVGPAKLRAGQTLTVSGDEATILLGLPDTFKPLDRIGVHRTTMLAEASVQKAEPSGAGIPAEECGCNGAAE